MDGETKECPRARYKSGRKAKPRVPHAPHEWLGGVYLPVGDCDEILFWCPGWSEES